MPSEEAKTKAEPNEHVLTFVRRSKVGGKGREENYKLFAALVPLIDELFLFSSSPSLQLPNAIFWLSLSSFRFIWDPTPSRPLTRWIPPHCSQPLPFAMPNQWRNVGSN